MAELSGLALEPLANGVVAIVFWPANTINGKTSLASPERARARSSVTLQCDERPVGQDSTCSREPRPLWASTVAIRNDLPCLMRIDERKLNRIPPQAGGWLDSSGHARRSLRARTSALCWPHTRTSHSCRYAARQRCSDHLFTWCYWSRRSII